MLLSFACAYANADGEQQKKQTEKTVTNKTQRCKAITKDGKQCKRNAEKGSIYCWQHKKKPK